MKIDSISVIIPSYHSRDLTIICLKSLERFRPSDLNINYFVVENTEDVSYKDEVVSLAENVRWTNNNYVIGPDESGSSQNASAIEISKEHIKDDFVFLAHCDVCVTNDTFFTTLFEKIEENELIGPLFDVCEERIGALHVSGLFMRTELMKKIDFFPRRIDENSRMDVGDAATLYCRENDLKHYCLKNTYNNPEVESNITDDRFKEFKVVRCVDDESNVIFMHLGRGIPKTIGTYQKANGKRVYLEDWVKFCKEILNGK